VSRFNVFERQRAMHEASSGWHAASGSSQLNTKLMEESSKARENGHSYALTTARNAAAAVERRFGPSTEPR
jgi:hypothetical protein